MPPVRKSTERKFLNGLRSLFSGFVSRVSSGEVNPGNAEQEARSFMRQLNNSDRVDRAVTTMIKSERDDTARSWREAVLKNTVSREMYKSLQKEMQGPVGLRYAQLIGENTKYIKTLPWAWAEHVTTYAAKEAQKGRRPEAIEQELREIMPERIQRNLKMIVRTECAKAHAALTQSRAETLGVKAYIWRSAKDERTRHSHLKMDGVMVFFNDPPNPEALFPDGKSSPYGSYHAGNTFNCRCYMEPVLNIKNLPDSVKLHYHGKVAYWSKAMIKKRFGKIA